MAASDMTASLRRLGLTPTEAEVWLRLLEDGHRTVEELAHRTDRTPDEVKRAAERLIERGLAATGCPDHACLAPVEPTLALDQLSHARAAELQQARLAAANAYRDHRRAVHRQATGDLVEVVSGPRIADRIRQFEGAAEHEIVRFDSPPYHIRGSANPLEIRNLERGVGYRVVYSAAAVQNAAYYAANIQPCIAAGEQARVLTTVPVKLTVFDKRLAIVSMSSVETEANDSLLLVHPSSLLSALLGFFESSWRSAYPMHLGDQIPPTLRPTHRRILELLGTGVTDDTIAQLLGISRRTLSRHLAQLYQRTGATNRFQLALHAAHKGWI
ncbi:helix-turn-helix domain-containing protein [Streptomyces sp. NPDC050161]|uniref:helix-turn-helix domain-containing protein n=1 Tax=Streptomyces sp. NPDC050161 TaxID=3365604 RepID=UPI0037AD59BF